LCGVLKPGGRPPPESRPAGGSWIFAGMQKAFYWADSGELVGREEKQLVHLKAFRHLLQYFFNTCIRISGNTDNLLAKVLLNRSHGFA